MSHCQCPNERSQQSTYSPGVVTCGEPIVYALIEPDNYRDGSAQAFSKSRLKQGQLSVCRSAHARLEDARQAILDGMLAKDPNRSDRGIMWAPSDDIRMLRWPGTDEQAICLVDHGFKDYRAHAHIGLSNPSDPNTRNGFEAVRGQLLSVFRKNGCPLAWDQAPWGAALIPL